jgi:hypothetical protein
VLKEDNTATVTTASVTGASPALAVGELLAVTEQFNATNTWYSDRQCGANLLDDETPDAAIVLGSCGSAQAEDQNDAILGGNEMLVARSNGQMNRISNITNNGDGTTKLTFEAPFHYGFSKSLGGDITRFETAGGLILSGASLTGIGIENLTVAYGGQSDGNISLWGVANSWVKNVESYGSNGFSIALQQCFRCEVRDSFLHSSANPNPGGSGYGMAFQAYTSDSLFENSISWAFNKVMVMASAGGGNVIGYNYFEDGYGAEYYGCPEESGNSQNYPTNPLADGGPWISTCSGIVEVGGNASHGTTTIHVLFEGNQSYNFDEDSTWGNSNNIVFFRNHATTSRRNIGNGSGTVPNNWPSPTCTSFSCFGTVVQLGDFVNRRGMGMNVRHWNHAYVGNVIGYPNGYLNSPAIGYAYPTWSPYPAGLNWAYEWTQANNPTWPQYTYVPMWQLAPTTTGPGTNGPDLPSPLPGANTQTALNTVVRDGNYDYFSNLVHWHGVPSGTGATNYGPLCTNGNTNCAGQYTTPPSAHTLPNSLYITSGPPAFFTSVNCPSGQCTWPWIDGSNASNPIPGALPARLRFDHGTPNITQ